MRPLWIAGAAVLAGWLLVRRGRLGAPWLLAGALAVAAVALVGVGVIPIPDFQRLIADAGRALGPWTYVLVGVLAFLETGAFIGLVAPGETTVLVGGVVAGQGEIDLVVLIAIVWACAVAGDVTSYVLGRRLGREFLVRHGPRVKITRERLEQVEAFFARRGGATILVGRFIGLVRAIAPFLAGASRMPLTRFLPYDVLGAGLWAALFCLLGYLFWRSLDRVTAYVGQGLLVFAALVALVVGVRFLRRLAGDAAERARAQAWLEAQAERPALRPLARGARPVWQRVAAPAIRHGTRPAHWLYDRLTPGELGLELTTLLALAAVGGYAFFMLGDLLGEHTVLPLDREAFSIADAMHARPVEEAVEVLTELGSFVVAAGAVLATATWVLLRHRRIEALALPVALGLTYLAVHTAQAALARPRPARALVETSNASFPSGHAAYVIALVACAVVLVRGGHGLAARFAAVLVAVVLAIAVALSRVYLRAHYLSDTLAGAALAVAVFALVGVVALVVAFLRHNPLSAR